jgi:hypothetical protein
MTSRLCSFGSMMHAPIDTQARCPPRPGMRRVEHPPQRATRRASRPVLESGRPHEARRTSTCAARASRCSVSSRASSPPTRLRSAKRNPAATGGRPLRRGPLRAQILPTTAFVELSTTVRIARDTRRPSVHPPGPRRRAPLRLRSSYQPREVALSSRSTSATNTTASTASTRSSSRSRRCCQGGVLRLHVQLMCWANCNSSAMPVDLETRGRKVQLLRARR